MLEKFEKRKDKLDKKKIKKDKNIYNTKFIRNKNKNINIYYK